MIPVTTHRVAPLITESTVLSLGAVLLIFTVSTVLCFGLCRVQKMHLGDVAQSDRVAAIERGRLTDIYRTQPVADDATTTTVAA